MVCINEDTIAAIATPVGNSSIAVIRVSGARAIEFTDKIYLGKSALSEAETHTINYGYIIDGSGDKVDEVLVAVMRSPRTFTREDVVEINCHGNPIFIDRILQELLNTGVRLAEPGEFSKRAFLNGRIDLTQAEAICELIQAKTEVAARIAVRQAEGSISRSIQSLREELLALLAHLAVNVDYPEYDVENLTSSIVAKGIVEFKAKLDKLLASAKQGKIYTQGIRVVIAGQPNVGKSSLMNFWAQENRAIVTDIPGTTRDVLQEHINIRGIPVTLLDTAGIRETDDLVESIGVQKSYQAIKDADLVLYVLSNNQPLASCDYEQIETLGNIKHGKQGIIVINKIDLPSELNRDTVRSIAKGMPILEISIEQETGLEKLEDAIFKSCLSGDIDNNDNVFMTNARQTDLLVRAKKSLNEALTALESGLPVDMAELDLQKVWQILGEITGETATDNLLDQIFSNFCLGK